MERSLVKTGVPPVSSKLNSHHPTDLVLQGDMECKVSYDGRVIKALDLKSNGIFPHRLKPYSQRPSYLLLEFLCGWFQK